MTILEMLVELYSRNRGHGHTTAMLEGAKATKAVVIVADNLQKESLVTGQLLRNQVIPLSQLERLRGYHGPIVVDHYAWQWAFWQHEQEKKKTLLAYSPTVKQKSVGKLLAKRKTYTKTD